MVQRAIHLNTSWGAPPYAANAVTFDGTNDYFSTASISGLVDGKAGLFSGWFKMGPSTNGNTYHLWFNVGGYFYIERTTANALQFIGLADPYAYVMDLRCSSSGLNEAAGWTHILASWNLATATIQLYRNDVSDAVVSSNENDNIHYSPSWHMFNVNGAGFNKWSGDVADIYFDAANSLDISVEANRRKFISATGKPVDLGSDGSVPLGSAPIIFLSGATASWHTNKGTGGGFSLAGGASLDTASTSPSD